MKIAIGIAIGNFLWQWLSGSRDWSRAAELSFFQAWAIGTYYFGAKL